MSVRVIATKDSGQFGTAQTVVRMNKSLSIEPVLPSVLIPGDQTVLAAVVKNISDHPVQDRLEFFSSDLSPKGDLMRHFSLQPGQQTEIAFSVFIDSSLEKEAIQVEFKSGNDKAESIIPLKHLKSDIKIANCGLLSDLWSGRIKLPKDVYSGLGLLRMSLGASPLVFSQNPADSLKHYEYESVYLQAVRLLLEADPDALQLLVLTLLSQADKSGGYRYWHEASSSPFLTAMVLLAYSRAAEEGVHIDSIQMNRTIDYLWKSLERDDLNPDDQNFILWSLGKGGQLDTERALIYFQNREALSLKGKAFLLMNLNQLIQAGQSSMTAAFDSLKSELLDAAIEEENMDLIYFNAPPKVNAVILYALSELGSSFELTDGLVTYLAGHDSDLIRQSDPEEILWITLAFRSYASKQKDSPVNFITQVKLNGELIMDQSVTGNSTNEVYASSVPVSSLSAEGVNDIFVKKDGTGPLYFDARLFLYDDPLKVPRLEEGMILVRELYEITEKNEKVPAVTFREGKHYLSRLRMIIPKDYSLVALTDNFPSGMKIVSGASESHPFFSQSQPGDSSIIYYAPYLPAGVYTVETELQAVLSGSYLHLPATIQVLFEPAVMSRTEGGMIEIID